MSSGHTYKAVGWNRLKKVYDSAEFKDFMSNRGFGTVWGDAAHFASFMDKGDAQMGEAMKAAGLSKT